jgi:hypothetical protein
MSTTYTDNAWSTWTYSSSTIYTNGTESAWNTWTSVDTGTTTGSAWTTWVTNRDLRSEITNDYTWITWTGQVEAIKETREQNRARVAQTIINAQMLADKEKETKEARIQAELTAQELLKNLISEKEMEIYLKVGRLLVKGKTHDYILTKGYQASVLKIEKNKIIDLDSYREKINGIDYCVHPVDQHKIPDTDKIISMKMALESEEDRIMKIANSRGNRDMNLAVGM